MNQLCRNDNSKSMLFVVIETYDQRESSTEVEESPRKKGIVLNWWYDLTIANPNCGRSVVNCRGSQVLDGYHIHSKKQGS
jgi:hypothetical protein